MGWATENQRWPALFLGHIEKPGKGRVKIRWYSVNNLRTRVEQSPMHPQDQAGGSSLQQCRVQPDTQACWCASSLSTKGVTDVSTKAMTDVPYPSCEDGGHVPSSRGPHWLAQGGRVEKMLVGVRGAWIMAGVPQA